MKVTIKHTKREETEFDVEFPIYREHHMDGATSYMKVALEPDGSMTEFAVDIVLDEHSSASIEDKSAEISVKKNYRFDSSGVDYSLGRGRYESSSAEFEEAVKIARSLLNAMK